MPAKYLEERVAELEAKIAKLENTSNPAPSITERPQPTLEEIYHYFEPHFPGMTLSENHYVHSKRSANDVAFFIKSNSKGILFHWETDHEERSHLRETYPKIQAIYPSAILNPSSRYPERITRILITIDQTRPLENIHSVINATKTIVGF